MRTIFQDSDYTMSLIRAERDTLESRRDQLTERFFQRRDVMSALSANGQTRFLGHGQTATSKKL